MGWIAEVSKVGSGISGRVEAKGAVRKKVKALLKTASTYLNLNHNKGEEDQEEKVMIIRGPP